MLYTLRHKVFQGILATLMQDYPTGGHNMLQQLKWKFQNIRVGCLGYVSIKVFESDSIWCSCDIIEWDGDINHAILNTNTLFGICMGFFSIAYGIAVTTDSTTIPRVVAGLNTRVFTLERQFWRFGVHLACFIGGLSV